MSHQRLKLLDAIELYVDGYGNSQTRKTKRRDLDQFVELVGGAWYLDEIDWIQMRRYQGRIMADDANNGRPYATNTRRTKLKSVRIFFNWCEKRGLIERNPTVDMDIPPEQVRRTREKSFNNDDVDKLIDYAEGRTALSGRRLRDLALLLFCHDTAVRRKSLEKMRRQDVDLLKREAIVVNTKTRGGERRYVVQFSPYTARVLGEWFGKLPDNPLCYLWNARQPGEYMSPDAISQVVGRMCDAVGIRRRAVHALRHHVAHSLADQGANENDISNILDNTPEVAARYYMPRDTETAFRKNSRRFRDDPDVKTPSKVVSFGDRKSG